ncbi:MAG: hypothetical protein H6Q01_1137 [Acidobacteria bacterium]|nr:hypothetical protein [Acidobacteriota bacterium]
MKTSTRVRSQGLPSSLILRWKLSRKRTLLRIVVVPGSPVTIDGLTSRWLIFDAVLSSWPLHEGISACRDPKHGPMFQVGSEVPQFLLTSNQYHDPGVGAGSPS